MEGTAAGTPIIAREGESGAELIEEYETGFLYKIREVTGPLTETFLRLFLDKMQYRIFPERCRKIALTEFPLEGFGKKMEVLYNDIFSEGVGGFTR